MTRKFACVSPQSPNSGRKTSKPTFRALYVLPVALLVLGACGPAPPKAKPSPATVYCLKQGGERVAEAGVGICHLPDGRVIEEWEYLRANVA